MALTNFILALFGPLSNFLLGLGKLKFLATSSVCMAILNAVALFTLLPLYGIVGAAWAYLISVLPVIYLFYYIETRYLNLPNRGTYYKKTIIGTMVVVFFVWLLNFFMTHFVISLPTLLIAGCTSVLAYVIFYKLFGFFDQEDWKDIERFASLFMKRLGMNLITHEK